MKYTTSFKSGLLVALLFVSAANASWFCCEDGGLTPGTWGLGIRAGVAPAIFTGRDCNEVIRCGSTQQEESFLGEAPKFMDVYKVPAYLAGEINYAVCDCVQVFGEVAWLVASAKDDVCNTFLPEDDFGRINLSRWETLAGYVGTRFYYGSCWDCINPFIGFKFGMLHYKEICATFCNEEGSVDNDGLLILDKSNVVSGGLQIGFDAPVWDDCLKFKFIFEVVPSCAPHTRIFTRDQFNNEPGEIAAFVPGHIGSFLAFPITAGFVYEF